ncbi:MAG: hypothetical protein AAB116_13350, partial [Candidatus Poribacteria bacterium]
APEPPSRTGVFTPLPDLPPCPPEPPMPAIVIGHGVPLQLTEEFVEAKALPPLPPLPPVIDVVLDTLEGVGNVAIP